jgi:hypothetical protein
VENIYLSVFFKDFVLLTFDLIPYDVLLTFDHIPYDVLLTFDPVRYDVLLTFDPIPYDVLLTCHKQTNKQTNAFNFFRMTLPSVEGI